MATYTIAVAYHSARSPDFNQRFIPGYSKSLDSARAKAIQYILKHYVHGVWIYRDGEYLGSVYDYGSLGEEFAWDEDNRVDRRLYDLAKNGKIIRRVE